MKKDLEKLAGRRRRFSAEFSRLGKKPKFIVLPTVETICLQNVVDLATGELVADHVWMKAVESFRAAGDLEPGMLLEFDARVQSYLKRGYLGDPARRKQNAVPGIDYTLKYPSRIQVVSR